MRVLRVINSLSLGGAERSIDTNVPEHIAHGIQMDVLVLNSNKTSFYYNLQSKGVKVINSYNCSIYNPLHIVKIAKLLNQYDIVHAHLFPALYWVAIAKLLTFNKKTKLVFTEHSTSNRRMQNRVFKPFDKFIYGFYDVIISISEATTNCLKLYFGEKVRVITVPNGIDLKPYQSNEKNEKLFDFGKGIKLITQVAGFRSEKDQKTVIKAMSFLPENIHVLFVGDGVTLNECKLLANSLEVNNRVHFLGFRSDVPQIVMNSDIIVMSSFIEGFGRAAVEGMAARKPVIATNVPGLADVVKGAGLLFPVGDAKSLADQIIMLLSDSGKYESVAESCFQRSLEYSSDKMIKGYEDVYYSLISN